MEPDKGACQNISVYLHELFNVFGIDLVVLASVFVRAISVSSVLHYFNLFYLKVYKEAI